MQYTVYIDYNYKGWILEAIVRESAAAIGLKLNIVFVPSRKLHLLNLYMVVKYNLNLKTNAPILFVNQNTYLKEIKRAKIELKSKQVRILFTHFPDLDNSISLYKEHFTSVDKIFVMNSSDLEKLVKLGLPKFKITVTYGAIDNSKYYPLKPNEAFKFLEFPYILIAGDCKERKSPKRLYGIAKQMPDLKFIFHGNGWKKFFLREFKKLPTNCEFHSFRITRHAEFMRQASVYLSLSKIEGGPYPTLEALASGTPTVATNTGWNSELINVQNGFLVEDDTTDSQIVKYITQCIEIKKSIFNLSLLPINLTWQTLGELIYN